MAQCKTHNYSAEEFTWIIARRGCYDAIFHRLLKMIDFQQSGYSGLQPRSGSLLCILSRFNKPEYNLINYELTKNTKADKKLLFGFPAFYSFFFLMKFIIMYCTSNVLYYRIVCYYCCLFFSTSTIYGDYIQVIFP